MGQFTTIDKIKPKTWFYFFIKKDKSQEELEKEGIVPYLKLYADIQIKSNILYNCISSNGDFDYAFDNDVVIPLENPVKQMKRLEKDAHKWNLLISNINRIFFDAKKEKIRRLEIQKSIEKEIK